MARWVHQGCLGANRKPWDILASSLCTEPITALAYHELVPVNTSSSPLVTDILQGA